MLGLHDITYQRSVGLVLPLPALKEAFSAVVLNWMLHLSMRGPQLDGLIWWNEIFQGSVNSKVAIWIKCPSMCELMYNVV